MVVVGVTGQYELKDHVCVRKAVFFNYPKNTFSRLELKAIHSTSHFKTQSRSSLPHFQRETQQTHIRNMLWTCLQNSKQKAMLVL